MRATRCHGVQGLWCQHCTCVASPLLLAAIHQAPGSGSRRQVLFSGQACRWPCLRALCRAIPTVQPVPTQRRVRQRGRQRDASAGLRPHNAAQGGQPLFELGVQSARACVVSGLDAAPDARVTFLAASGIMLARPRGSVLLSLPHGEPAAELRLLHVQRWAAASSWPPYDLLKRWSQPCH